MPLLTAIKSNLRRWLRDVEFRRQFISQRAQNEIASQIRSLRRTRKLTQAEVAKRSGMLQSAISRLEQADYAGWSFKSLVRVADALDAVPMFALRPLEEFVADHERPDVAHGAPISTAESVEEMPISRPVQRLTSAGEGTFGRAAPISVPADPLVEQHHGHPAAGTLQ